MTAAVAATALLAAAAVICGLITAALANDDRDQADDEPRRVQPGPAAQKARDEWLRRNPDYARRLTDPLLPPQFSRLRQPRICGGRIAAVQAWTQACETAADMTVAQIAGFGWRAQEGTA